MAQNQAQIPVELHWRLLFIKAQSLSLAIPLVDSVLNLSNCMIMEAIFPTQPLDSTRFFIKCGTEILYPSDLHTRKVATLFQTKKEMKALQWDLTCWGHTGPLWTLVLHPDIHRPANWFVWESIVRAKRDLPHFINKWGPGTSSDSSN